MPSPDWIEVRAWAQLALLATTALAALAAAWYGRRSADAARDSAGTAIASATAAERALNLDIERLERLRTAEEEARRPRVVVHLVRTPRGLDLYESAEAVVENTGASTAVAVHVRLASLDRGVQFGGDVPALVGRGATVVPCQRSGGDDGLPQGNGWVAAAIWQDEAGAQRGDLDSWTSVSFEEVEPVQRPPRARFERSP